MIRIKDPRKEKRLVLSCGADESNHGGLQHKIGEVIVVTFSLLDEDAIPMPFPHNRDYLRVQEWLKHGKRDYLYTVLIGEEYRHTYSNLPFAVPRIIDEFLRRKSIRPTELNICLDGPIKTFHKSCLAQHFKDYISSIRVSDFPKSNRSKRLRKRDSEEKLLECPAVVYSADVISNQLYTDKVILEQILSSEKMVSI